MLHLVDNRIFIFAVVSTITVFSFLARLETFKKTKILTLDGMAYYYLSSQMAEDITKYNTAKFEIYIKENRPSMTGLITSKPLFSHPVLFTFLSSRSILWFGDNYYSTYYISALMGVLIIPLTYLLGSLIYGRLIGLLASFLVFMDPINIMCSQKIWLETTLSFFTVLTIVLFLYALNRDKSILYILTGISGGMAVLTKYPGILAIFSIFVYSVLFNRNLFKYKRFVVSLCIPFLMLIPWIYWNVSVYGVDFFSRLLRHGQSEGTDAPRFIYVSLLLLGVGLIAFTSLLINKKIRLVKAFREILNKTKAIVVSRAYLLKIVICLIAVWLIRRSILPAFNLNNFPVTSWKVHFFVDEPWYFYFGKLVEFSFVYALGFLSYLYFNDKEGHDRILKLSAIIILVFYTIWGNFQSRYILAATPFLIVLGVNVWMNLFLKVSRLNNSLIKVTGRFFLILLVAIILTRTYLINIFVCFPNNMCYF